MYPISSIRGKLVVICCAALFAALLASSGCNGDGEEASGETADEEDRPSAEEVRQRMAEATVAVTENDIVQLRTGVEIHYVTNGELPERLEELTEGMDPIFDAIPDDPWGNEYVYEVEGEREFEIFSTGPDGEAGTEADITVD